MPLLDDLKAAIKAKLPELELVVAWKQGFDPLHATPAFMKTEADVDQLVVGPLSVHNTATYLTGLKGKKIGVVVKGCDSRAIVQLMQEQLLNKDDITVFGFPCSGVVDMAKIKAALGDGPYERVTAVTQEGQTLKVTTDGKTVDLPMAQVANDKCGRCRFHNAVVSDVFVGDKLEPTVAEDPYEDLAALEAKPVEGRMDHWRAEMDRCIRCYACRNACPMCVCRDHCVADSRDPHWLSQEDALSQKWMFQMIHAMHLAGRCVECGECQRACPMDIPILTLRRKINKEIKALFDHEAGVNPAAIPPLMAFKVEEENINERGW